MEPKQTWIRDGCWIVSIMLLGLFLRLIVISNTVVTARDSIGFIRYALNLENPPQGMTSLDVIRKELHPPGYVSMVMFVSKPVRAIVGGTTAEAMTLSCQIVSVIASILLIIPMYLLGLRLFDRRVAAISCILFQVLPVCVQVTSDGLSDGLFLLTILTSVWFGVRGLEQPSFVRFTLAGMASGSAYLIRPEGLIVVGALGLTGIILKMLQRISWNAMLRSGLGILFGVLLTAGPYVAIIGKLTNKTTGNGLIEWIKGEDNGPVWKARPVEDARRVVDLPIAAWWNDGINKDENKLIWGLKSLAAETFKTSHYFGLFLAGFGFVCFGGRIRQSSSLLFVVLLMILHATLLWVMAAKIGYVSQRHTLLIVSLGLYFSAIGLIELVEWINQFYARNGYTMLESLGRRYGLASGVGLLILCSLPSALKPLHANRAGHRAAGEWLAEHAPPESVIWDPFAWSEFYAGRSMYVDPDRNYTRADTYVILEPFNPNPHSKLPMIPIAKAIAAKGKIVYHWPEQVPLEKAKVVIYQSPPMPGPIQE